MAQMKTPGVYIQEKNAFSTTVVEAATAIPAFIGITEKAVNGSESLANKPWKINSMTEFIQYFGGAPLPEFKLSVADQANDDAQKYLYCSTPTNGKFLLVEKPANLFTLYYNLVLFFANGGGTCYIVSVGTYSEKDVKKEGTTEEVKVLLSIDKVETALGALKKVREVTMIVIPEAVMNPEGMGNIQTDVLKHCGEMKNRMAILDLPLMISDGKSLKNPIETFHDQIGSNYLAYGAAYYPYLNTSVLAEKDIECTMLKWPQTPDWENLFVVDSENDKAEKKLAVYLTSCFTDLNGEDEDKKLIAANNIHNTLLVNWPAYKLAVKVIKDFLNVLPPSAAIAGIYTMVDNTRGVWKAPANVSINYVNSLTEDIDDKDQEDLNMPMNGKAINAIRTFPGEGVKVWGARTLDGNSQDWRYINVRRTMNFLEESIRNAAKAYVFEPNVSTTWINVQAMISSFLRGVWKDGGLAGASPEDAYQVHVGLGDTMTGDDILNGIMRVTVLVAISRPAEFIEITFQQQMQKS